MKSIKSHLILLLIITTSLSIVAGCSSNQDPNYSVIEEEINLADSIINEEVPAEEGLTLIELKNLLETSTSIEVKNIDNQTIGKLSTGENINKTVMDIFSYDAIDNYNYSPDEEVVATISFFFSSNEPIYGLIKDQFIYIEGYYFVPKNRNNSIQKIVNYFKTYNEEEPIV